MKKVYYTPSNPGSLGSEKETGVQLTDKQVSDWLVGEDAYTLYRTAPLKYKSFSLWY